MEIPDRSSRAPGVLRLGLHLLTVVLLALAAVRAVAAESGGTRGIVAAVAMALVYLAGARAVRGQGGRRAGIAWLVALAATWLALLAVTADGVWLAFPLFVLCLHLLPMRVGVAAVAATTVVAVAGFAVHQGLSPAGVIGPGIGALVSVAGALGYQALYRESERRRVLLDQLAVARDELTVAGHAAGVAAERERLAREIHDTLAQGLSSIQLLLRAAERTLPESPETHVAAGHVEQARRTAQDNLAEARRFVRALTPPDLEDGSLPAALQRLCTTTARQSGLPVDFRLSGAPIALASPYEVALLRIAQSALANTTRHAHASRAAVTLSYMDDRIALDIVDDGAGFDPAAPPRTHTDGGFGLPAMRARTRDLGGTLSVESAPGRGAALAVSIPRPPNLLPRSPA